MNFNPDYIFYIIFAAIACYLLYQIVTKGFKGALFGGKVEKTFGEIGLEKQNIISGKLRVHKIISETGNMIGIEIIQKSFLGYQMTPATLKKEEAVRLIQLLTQATNET